MAAASVFRSEAVEEVVPAAALFSSDIKLLRSEGTSAGAAYRQRLTAVGSVADQTDIPLLLQEIAQLCPIRLVRIRNAYSDLVLHIHFPL